MPSPLRASCLPPPLISTLQPPSRQSTRIITPIQQECKTSGTCLRLIHSGTAGINQSNTAVRAVLKQPCLTGGPAGTGRTNLSDQLALALVGQCPSDHRSNTAVRAPLEQPCSTG
ncbi:hypothetical protein PCANC_23083 [Puccinia coronata f. sp. avenae]|uniref:Uncharacterized protein n=1 Tax=Puccinia coronata f. sp. avenae TaxID=200324 RepID=A0A2N5U7F0_9BASI|nr:hypothetical protein PCANC_23083 [Puccinia coronata f. sp. avenae]